jgi:hypothetical protein
LILSGQASKVKKERAKRKPDKMFPVSVREILVMTDDERAVRIGKLNLDRADARRKLAEVGVISRDLAGKFSELAAALDPQPSRGHANAEWLVSHLKPELAQFVAGDKLVDLIKNKTALEEIVAKCSRELVALRVEEEPDGVAQIGRRT